MALTRDSQPVSWHPLPFSSPLHFAALNGDLIQACSSGGKSKNLRSQGPSLSAASAPTSFRPTASRPHWPSARSQARPALSQHRAGVPAVPLLECSSVSALKAFAPSSGPDSPDRRGQSLCNTPQRGTEIPVHPHQLI